MIDQRHLHFFLFSFQCQNRGTAKFNSPQESSGISTDNLEQESDKTLRNNRPREIGNVGNVNAHRKYRYRSKDESEDNEKPRNGRILPPNHKESPIDDSTPIVRKRPVVRVGRRRTTTPIPSAEIPMVVPIKVYQTDNQKRDKEVVVDGQEFVKLNVTQEQVDNATSSNDDNFEQFKNLTQDVPFTRRPPPLNVTRVTTNVTNSTSTRISIRKGKRYQANASGKVESISTETSTQRIIRRPIVRSTEKIKIDSEDTTTPLPPPLSRGTVRSSVKTFVKDKPNDLDDIDDENYPEHFKLLLKANHQSNPSTTSPGVNKDTKFKNFKSRKVVPYRGYKQNSTTSTTVTPPAAVESNFKFNLPRNHQSDKRSKNVSVESNDVYVKDLDLTKENFNLVKETNYPEATTPSGQYRPQSQQKETMYKITTFKPAVPTKLLTRNKLFRQRGPTTSNPDVNAPQIVASQAPVTIKEVSRIYLAFFFV